MSKEGSKFIPDPNRGLLKREDLNRLCHWDVQEEVNTWLKKFATTDKTDHASLKLVAVNPDGDRRVPNYFLCFWHPAMQDLDLKNTLFHPDITSDIGMEACRHREFHKNQKEHRTVARSLVRMQEVYSDQQKEEEKEG